MAKKDTSTGYELSGNAIQSYLDAKTAQRNIRTNWDTASDLSDQLLGSVQNRQEAKRVDEDNKRKELEAHEEQFSNNILKITESAGGMGEEYYGLATEQAKLLQGEYMEAVRAGDKEAQTKIKMKLQGLATSSGSLKESLTIAAELKNEGLLSDGRTAEEIKIANICTNPANAIYQDGEYVWKDPETGQTYTQVDLDKSLGQIDEVTSKAYLDYEMGQNEAGMNYVNGTGADFDFSRIKTSISDQFIKEDNIMSIMHDDFRKSGKSNTFKAHLKEYLQTSGLIESFHDAKNKDGSLKFDTEGGEGIDTPAEIEALMEAIYNKEDGNYDFKVSKDIVADYLTRQSEEKFYGSHPTGLSSTERKAIRPEPGDTEKMFLDRGGILGELAKEGTIWNEDLGRFEVMEYDSESIDSEYEESLKK
jgi:hypothetical protein